jgi:Ser/Thr protein kinase RdoA (MazF antagonist)
MEGTSLWLAHEVARAKKRIASFPSSGEFSRQVADVQKSLKSHGLIITKLPSAECHLDYDSDNILTDGKKVTAIIDFGDVTHAPLVMDIGNSLCWWLFCNPQRVGPNILSRYLAAYSSVRALTEEEKVLLPVFIKLRNLGLAAYFYQHELRSGKSYLQKTVQFNKFVDTLHV